VSGEETDLCYETQLSVVDFAKQIMTKIITISPQFILLNLTDETLSVCQSEYPELEIKL
jgi:hypothetical protein